MVGRKKTPKNSLGGAINPIASPMDPPLVDGNERTILNGPSSVCAKAVFKPVCHCPLTHSSLQHSSHLYLQRLLAILNCVNSFYLSRHCECDNQYLRHRPEYPICLHVFNIAPLSICALISFGNLISYHLNFVIQLFT